MQKDGRGVTMTSRCLLCGTAASVVGVFVPDDPAAFGGTSGKSRLIRYGLCAKCSGEDDLQATVEKVILAELKGGIL